jgi:hypothetical protein
MSRMLATGGLLVAIALLMLAVLVQIFRSSDPPRWTTRGWISEVLAVMMICTLALGAVRLGAGTIEAFRTAPDYLDLGLLALVMLVSIVVWRKLRKGAARPKAVESAGVGPRPRREGRERVEGLGARAAASPVRDTAAVSRAISQHPLQYAPGASGARMGCPET